MLQFYQIKLPGVFKTLLILVPCQYVILKPILNFSQIKQAHSVKNFARRLNFLGITTAYRQVILNFLKDLFIIEINKNSYLTEVDHVIYHKFCIQNPSFELIKYFILVLHMISTHLQVFDNLVLLILFDLNLAGIFIH